MGFRFPPKPEVNPFYTTKMQKKRLKVWEAKCEIIRAKRREVRKEYRARKQARQLEERVLQLQNGTY